MLIYFKMQFIHVMAMLNFTPVLKVTWFFRNHYNMLIWCSRNVLVIIINNNNNYYFQYWKQLSCLQTNMYSNMLIWFSRNVLIIIITIIDKIIIKVENSCAA